LLRHFGKNVGRYLSLARQELLEQGAAIEALRARLGDAEPNDLLEQFKVYRRNAVGPNALGEPKLKCFSAKYRRVTRSPAAPVGHTYVIAYPSVGVVKIGQSVYYAGMDRTAADAFARLYAEARGA